MTTLLDNLTYENPVLRAYVFWSSILILKMLVMSFLTGMKRFATKTFANQEDLPDKKFKPKFDDPDVERVRRAHRNDLENILPFFVAGFFYVLTNPDAFIAVNIFRAAAIARIVHTLVYAVVVVPQPARAIAWFVCFGATAYMALHTTLYFI
ncbi:unnamed protein product [Diamesa hyperborea]